MFRKILLGITLSVCTTIVACVCLEIGLRIYQARTQTRTTIQWHDDILVGRRLNPSQIGQFVSDTREYRTEVEINSHGFRDIEHSPQKNVFRILLLGDSFVENLQVSLHDTIFKQLEHSLSEKLGKPVEVVAMGLGDSGTAQQLLLLNSYGLSYKPDLVVQLFFSGNDVKNNSLALMQDPYRPYYTLEENKLVLQPFHTRSQNISYKLVSFAKRHSRLLEFILNAKGKLSSQVKGFPIDYEVYRKEPNDQYQTAWRVTEALLSETKHSAEANGANYLLISLANNEQVNEEVQKELIEKYPKLGSSDFNFEQPDEKLRVICNTNSISCQFMYQTFKDYIHENKVVTHYPKDGHFNKIGTDLAAQFVTNAVINYLRNK